MVLHDSPEWILNKAWRLSGTPWWAATGARSLSILFLFPFCCFASQPSCAFSCSLLSADTCHVPAGSPFAFSEWREICMQRRLRQSGQSKELHGQTVPSGEWRRLLFLVKPERLCGSYSCRDTTLWTSFPNPNFIFFPSIFEYLLFCILAQAVILSLASSVFFFPAFFHGLPGLAFPFSEDDLQWH